MSYVGSGYLPDSSLVYNATKNVYRGADADTTSLFKEYQSQLNRFSSAAGFSKLTVDGVIGTKTGNASIAACKWIAKNAIDLSNVMQSGANMSQNETRYFATHADELKDKFKAAANKAGLAGAAVSGLTTPGTNISLPGTSAGFTLPFPPWILLAAGALLLGPPILKSLKRKRR